MTKVLFSLPLSLETYQRSPGAPHRLSMVINGRTYSFPTGQHYETSTSAQAISHMSKDVNCSLRAEEIRAPKSV